MGDHVAAMHARANAHVDHVVGSADGVFIVFHHQHGIADVAQVLQGIDQAVVVALVQADGGFVQHIHHAGQARADLRSQADALGFAARERIGAAFQREIVQADVVEEGQARDDFLDDAVGDFLLGTGQLQGLEERQGLAQRRGSDFVDGTLLLAATHLHIARFHPQAGTVAGRALLLVDELGQFFLDRHRIGFAIAALQVVDHAFEGVLLDHRAAALVDVGERNGLAARTVEHRLLRLVVELLEGHIEVEAVVGGDAGQHLEVELVAAIPALDRARGQRQVGEGDDALGIEEFDMAQAIAFRAGAHRVVEGEQARLQFLQRIAADGAGELVGIQVFLAAVHFQRNGAAIGQAQRGLEALGQTLLDLGLDLHAVDDDVDGVLLGLLQLGQVIDLVDLGRPGAALDAEAHEALGLHLLEQVGMFALAVGYHGRHDHQLGVFRQRQYGIDHLRDRLRLQRMLGVVRAIRRTDAGVQQAQVVVDLGDGTDGGARVVRRRLLFDRDGRGQAFDHVDIGLFHQLQELARVGRQRLHVAALPLGIQGIEGQRRLARTGQASNDDELVAGEV